MIFVGYNKNNDLTRTGFGELLSYVGLGGDTSLADKLF